MHQHNGIQTHLWKRTLALFDDEVRRRSWRAALLTRFFSKAIAKINLCAARFPRHPNLIHQNTIAKSFVSLRTGRRQVSLGTLTSEEVNDLTLIAPELLFDAGVPAQFIEPFRLLNGYCEKLFDIGPGGDDLGARHALRAFVDCVEALDFVTPQQLVANYGALPRQADDVEHAAVVEAADDDVDSLSDNDDSDSDAGDGERFRDDDDDDDGDGDGDDDNANANENAGQRRVNWRLPKILV